LAFTVTFPTTADLPPVDDVASWIRQRGEPLEVLTAGCLQLRALDVRVLVDERVRAQISVTESLPLTRVVDLLFDLSIFLRADVRLTGVGEVNRGGLWMRLADDQDRSRIANALLRAKSVGRMDEVGKRLWQVVSAVRPGCDDRWDQQHERIVELKEVGAADGISLADAAWHADDPQPGDVIPVPVEGSVHTLAWRWLSEAYPNYAESEHTLH
jgi:hypothetical protein